MCLKMEFDFICDECQMGFHTDYGVREHYYQVHKKEFLYFCMKCSWQVTYDLPLLETSKVYSGFLNDGVLLLNVWFSQLQVRMVNALSGISKRVCLTTIHVLFSSSHTQFLLYVSLIAQLCIYISKCPCPCYWPCGFCGRTYKISCKSQICV